MDRVEQLVALLYTPGVDRVTLEQAQRELLAAQKSPQGWELAGAMLSSANVNTQFLGAQAFMVKLNQGTDIPSPQEQRLQLLEYLRRAISSNIPAFVIRKLLGVITKVFLNSSDWTSCVIEVIQIVGAGSPHCYDFLKMLIEDSELSAGDLRAKLVPNVSQVVIDLLGNVGFFNDQAIKTLEVWATAFFDVFKPIMSSLIGLVTQTYFNTDAHNSEEVCLSAMKCLENLYSYDFRSWPPLAKRQLGTALEQIVSSYSEVPPPDFADDVRFLSLAKLVMTYCSEDFQQTALHPFIAKLAATETHVVDDPLAVEVIGFWNQYTEEVISTGLSSDVTPVIASVISNYWPRIKIYNGLRPSDWEEFASFRKDFADFIELSYPLLGNQLFEHLTSAVLTALPNLDWFSIESGIYCLNGLSDIIGDDYRGEVQELKSIQRIFQSDLWMTLPQCDNFRVKQTAVNFIGCFVDFFASPEGHSYLAVTLNYLFTCLSEKPLQNTASRSIQKLCETCRTLLTGEIGAFIAIYGQIREGLQTVPHIRTVSGIAYVVQAQADLAHKADALDKLLDLILTAESIDASREENRQCQLKCIAAVGKGLKEVDDTSNNVNQTSAPSPDVIQFWQTNEIAMRIRRKIESIIESALRDEDVITVEAICDIVKSGMTEDAGPFVLDETVVIKFIVSKFHAGPSTVLSPVLELAKFYVMTRRTALKSHKENAISSEYLGELMIMLDQDITVHSLSAALDLMTQFVILARTANVTLLDLGPMGALRHAYIGLTTNDRFVIKSATTFWKEFLASDSLTAAQAEPLMRIILQQISTQATRSELGAFVDILKHLLSKHALIVAPFLKDMVVENPITENIQKLDAKIRRDFVAQMLLLKGGRKSFDVAQKFWLQCHNIPENYNPVVHLDV